MIHQRLTTQIRAADRQLTDACRSRGITVGVYKAVRYLFRGAGIALIGLSWFTPTVEPSATAYLVFTALILGPDVVEAYLTHGE